MASPSPSVVEEITEHEAASEKAGRGKAKRDRTCRVCNDFHIWARLKGTAKGAAATSASGSDSPPGAKGADALPETRAQDEAGRPASSQCPPDAARLGRHTWTLLHSVAAYYPDEPSDADRERAAVFMASFSHLYPCHYCAEHLQQYMQRRPPDVRSALDFSRWMCEMHNEVNSRLGKPAFDCSRVLERWREGPPDGSCG